MRAGLFPKARAPSPVGSNGHSEQRQSSGGFCLSGHRFFCPNIIAAHVLPAWSGVTVHKGNTSSIFHCPAQSSLEIGGCNRGVAMQQTFVFVRHHHIFEKRGKAFFATARMPHGKTQIFLLAVPQEVAAQLILYVRCQRNATYHNVFSRCVTYSI